MSARDTAVVEVLPQRAIPAHVRLLGVVDRVLTFPEDTKYWAMRNRKEFVRALADGKCKRRVPAL